MSPFPRRIAAASVLMLLSSQIAAAAPADTASAEDRQVCGTVFFETDIGGGRLLNTAADDDLKRAVGLSKDNRNVLSTALSDEYGKMTPAQMVASRAKTNPAKLRVQELLDKRDFKALLQEVTSCDQKAGIGKSL